MRNYRTTTFPMILALCFFLMLAGASLTRADELPKSINLNLTLPPPNREEEQQHDTITEKYNEVMGEITISEEAAWVVEQIKDVVLSVEDISMDVVITEIKAIREEVVASLKASVEAKVGRIEFQGPDALRGIMAVLDQTKMETRMFMPVTNKILVTPLEDASKEALSALSVSQITSYFDFSQYEVVVLEASEEDGITDYLLDVTIPNDQDWHVRVKSDTWIPYEIAVFEKGVPYGIVVFRNVALNPGLCLEQIIALPKVKEERM